MTPTMDGAGPYEGRTLEVTFTYAKAIYASAVGFVTPAASYVVAQLVPGGDGHMSGNDWLIAGALCVLGAGVAGGGVAAIQNKAKVTAKGPA